MFKFILSCHLLVVVAICIPVNLYSDTVGNGKGAVSSHIIINHDNVQSGKGIADKFDGELLKYDIGFWIFKKAGVATYKCERKGDSLIITIDVCTTGIFDKIIHRHNTYITTAKIKKGTNKIVPINSIERKVKRKKVKTMTTIYDYENNIREFKMAKNGVFHRGGKLKIGPEVSDDVVSVGYNLRNEVYGEIKDGASFNISTFYKDKIKSFQFDVHSIENTEYDFDMFSEWDDIASDVKYVADITINAEMIDSKEGKLIALYTEDLLPIAFIVKDIIGFGDLYGFLVREIN